MRKPSLVPVAASHESGETHPDGQGLAAPARRNAGDHEQAARGPAPEPVSAAENPAPALPADTPAEAQGRRTLSTAFVRMGAGEHLTVELRDGRTVALRDVVMRRNDYCGVQVRGGTAGPQFCGGYGDVAAARSGGAPALDQPGPAVLNPAEAGHSPSERE